MRTKITCLALLVVVVAMGLLAYTAQAGYQEQWWQKTVSGVTLKQGVAIDLNKSQNRLWGSNTTWASAYMTSVSSRNVGGENCAGFPFIYWDQTKWAYNTNNVNVTALAYYPGYRPCSPRIFASRGWSTWTGPGISQSHNMALYQQ
jgi:hypothetical protein